MFIFAKRVLLFLATNMAVMLLLGIIMAVVTYFFPGLSTAAGGMYYLLIYAAVLGFGGALISLAISRWSAKRGYSIVLVNDENIHTMPAKLQLVHSTVARIAMAE
jgi:heat shock protein HtpX